MSSDSHATITYTTMSSYEVIVNGYFGMPMDPLDLYVQLVMEAPPSPDYIPGPEAPPSPDYIPGPEYPDYLLPADDVLPAKEQPLPATVSPTAKSPRYIMDSEPAWNQRRRISISASEDSDETEPFEEGETIATPPPFGYRVTARISRARFTTPTRGYEVGESSVAAEARQIRPALTHEHAQRDAAPEDGDSCS
nr:hypothetical protein [Tanacetum cinerariifolium]